MWHVGSPEKDINKKGFIQRLSKPWNIDKIKNVVDHYSSWLLPAPAHLATKLAGYLGIKPHPRTWYPIPIHLWGNPMLHDKMGLVKDWLTRVEKLADGQVEIIPLEKVATRDHLIIHNNRIWKICFGGAKNCNRRNLSKNFRNI
jgi:hypothetical protein